MFSLNQPGQGKVTYTLPVNNGPNALHGGIVGFGNHIWADKPVVTSSAVGVQLTLVSPNGDEGAKAGSPGCPNGCTGYPAQVKVVLTYTLNNRTSWSCTTRPPTSPEPQHGRQPDQPQLLQPGRRELVPRLGLRPADPDQREQVHADRHHLDPARLQRVRVRHAVQLHPLLPDGRPDSRRQRAGQFPGLQPAPRSPGLRPQLGTEPADPGHHRPARPQPGRPRPRPVQRPPTHRMDRPARRPVLHQQLPDRDAGGHQRPRVPPGPGVHLRDPALPELAQPAQLPLHRAEGGPDRSDRPPSSRSPRNTSTL